MQALPPLFFIIVLSNVLNIGQTAKCGHTEFFEFNFRPIEIKPVLKDDLKDLSTRCGEPLCDFMVTVLGDRRCHKNSNHAYQMMAPVDQNSVKGNEFSPLEEGRRVFGDWGITDRARATKPLEIDVCDDDNIFRGPNDHVMTVKHQKLREGCHRYEHKDSENDHPIFFKYEICCYPTEDKRRRRRRNARLRNQLVSRRS